MDVDKTINVKDYEIGVIVARFQVDEIHAGQKEFLDFVCKHHKKVILFLGIARGEGLRDNALDFATRKIMIQTDYPNIVCLPQLNQKSDIVWSKNLDAQIDLAYGGRKTLLYGSRDSFIPHYLGRHETVELAPTIQLSGTEIREEISKEILNEKAFRTGIIHQAYAQRPKVYPTVDIACYNDKGQILMAKKHFEKDWRFIGGFVDVTDESYEMAARREFSEESNGCDIQNLRYQMSTKVDDWRYRGTENGIMTTLFLGRFGRGRIAGTDDIEEVKWFDISYFTRKRNIENDIVKGHQNMLSTLITKIYEDNLVPNLGEFYKEVIEPKSEYQVVRDDKYKIK